MYPTPRLYFSALLLAGMCATATAQSFDKTQPGLRVRDSALLSAGTALVDFALPRPAFLGHAALGHDMPDSSTSTLARLLPSWRLLNGEAWASSGGLRASGGMVGVSRWTAFQSRGLLDAGPIDLSMTLPRRAWASQMMTSVPYVGVGYTNAGDLRDSWASTWRFSADLGVMALSPSSAARLNRVVGGQQTLDDALRDMRLAPLLQVGVSYTF
ncbi:MAG: hypothetical protein ABI574_18260 [Burkholderiales bacterium]